MSDFFAAYRKQLESVAQGDLGGSVELLLNTMPPARANLLRRCAIPHQFDRALLTVLDPSMSEKPGDEAWEQLTRLSSVIPSDPGVALHDDVREYLFRQWLAPDRSEEFRAVSARLVKAVTDAEVEDAGAVGLAARQRRMFHRIGTDRDAGFADFEQLIRRARGEFRFDECERLIDLVREYHGWLSEAQETTLLYHEAKLAADRRLFDEAETKFKAVSERSAAMPAMRAKALNRLGMLHGRQRRWHEAIRTFSEAQDIADGDAALRPILGRVLHEWGVVLRDKGDLAEAEPRLSLSVSIANETSNALAASVGLNSLGTLYRRRGDYRKAIESYETALRHLTDHGERFRPAQICNNLGLALADARQWKESEAALHRSLEIKRAAGDTHGQAVTLQNLVRTYWNLDRQREALDAVNEAVTLFSRLGDPYSAGLAKRDAGRMLRRQRAPTATPLFEHAIELFAAAGRGDIAEETRRELEDRKQGLPWWIWVCIGLIATFFLLIVVLIALDL